MEPSGIDSNGNNGTDPASCSANTGTEIPACGPGCGCGEPSRGGKLKLAVSLIVALAVVGIVIYKAAFANDNAANKVTAQSSTTYGFAGAAPSIRPDATTRPSASAVPGDSNGGQKIGEYLESLSELNKVALDQDAVFVFIPDAKNELASDQTNSAVVAARQTLTSAKVTLGLYTLPASSADYAKISAQVQAPAILVACKGKGMVVVSGDVTRDKLLQAFVATSSAGGCGPSGCAPSSTDCN